MTPKERWKIARHHYRALGEDGGFEHPLADALSKCSPCLIFHENPRIMFSVWKRNTTSYRERTSRLLKRNYKGIAP